jgi:dolichyl-phosphate beta-glucosyltransferase
MWVDSNDHRMIFFIGSLLLLISFLLILYLFYPALLTFLQPSLEPCRVQILHAPSIAKADEDKGEAPQNSTLSIIIPAYNEQERLPKMLQAATEYLESPGESTMNNSSLLALSCSRVEWIVVSDGSTDQTETFYREFVDAWNKATTSSKNNNNPSWTWTLVVLPCNSGKGAAVRAGMLHASGAWRIMVDADGATDFGPGLEGLARAAATRKTRSDNDADNNKDIIIVGSRAHLQTTATAQKRSIVRQALMHAFHFFCASLVGSNDIQDTQCGFKLFSSSAADQLFRDLHLRGWAFDTELLYMGMTEYEMTVLEVPVPWQEVDGSKLNTSAWNLGLVAVTMLRDMICIRLCYTLGIWKVNGGRKPIQATASEQSRRKRD